MGHGQQHNLINGYGWNDLLSDGIKPVHEPMLTRVESCGIYLRAISQEMLKISIHVVVLWMNLKISNSRLQPHSPGATEFIVPCVQLSFKGHADTCSGKWIRLTVIYWFQLSGNYQSHDHYLHVCSPLSHAWFIWSLEGVSTIGFRTPTWGLCQIGSICTRTPSWVHNGICWDELVQGFLSSWLMLAFCRTTPDMESTHLGQNKMTFSYTFSQMKVFVLWLKCD